MKTSSLSESEGFVEKWPRRYSKNRKTRIVRQGIAESASGRSIEREIVATNVYNAEYVVSTFNHDFVKPKRPFAFEDPLRSK